MTNATYADHDVVIHDLSLHYQEWGDPSRPTVLLLHGFGVSGHMFDEFASRAADRFHLVALDLRGHGDSAWAPDGDYRHETIAADVERVREALGISSFILLGHAMGGLAAVSYAANHPGHMRGLVLVDVAPETGNGGVDDVHRFTHADDELDFEEFVERAHRANPERDIENIRERMRHRLKQTESGKWTWKYDRRFKNDRESLRMGSDMTADQEWDLFRRVTVPTLIVRGSKSDALGQEVAERIAAEMQRARLVVVPGAGHSVPGDNPDDFASLTLAFFDEIDSGLTPPPPDGAGAPIAELVRENESARRRGAGIGTLIALGVGAALATVGIGWTMRRRREKRRKEEARRSSLQGRFTPPADLAGVPHRMATLAGELADVGRAGAERARALAADPQVQSALAQARSRAGEAGHRSLEAVQNVDTRRLRREGARAAHRSRSVAASGARAAKGMARRQRPRRSVADRLLPWRS